MGTDELRADLIEQLADAEHASWARWMDYLFSRCHETSGGEMVIPPELVRRWQQQSATHYAELSEREKQSDREEVAHILPFIDAYAQALARPPAPDAGERESAVVAAAREWAKQPSNRAAYKALKAAVRNLDGDADARPENIWIVTEFNDPEPAPPRPGEGGRRE